MNHLPGARDEGAKKMSREECLRRVGVLGSLSGRRSEVMVSERSVQFHNKIGRHWVRW